MWIMICCWECLLVQNLAEHFKSCMGAQRRPWAYVILSDKKNHLFSRATDILWDNYFGMQIFCGCLLPIIMLFIYLFILLQSVNPDFEFVFYNWPALKKKIWFDIPVIFAMVAFKLPFFLLMQFSLKPEMHAKFTFTFSNMKPFLSIKRE